ncbi:hypothetical protein B0T19DRAFT_443913 [Cercophora scortea]|uniref:2EXR domain-containing protein n=1 Tax=Cercophora scortea TaxID=314031 RepID=A0AAE0MA13_9PEZI|nr:hypothetical protein B0T19DRAFT_443913 [Cercophora scortea]
MDPETNMESVTQRYPKFQTDMEMYVTCQCHRPVPQRRHSCAAEIPSAPTWTRKPVRPIAPLPPRRSFLDLPPEIRIMIYKHLLQRSPVTTIYQMGNISCPDSDGTLRVGQVSRTIMKLFPAILLTCREIFCEARSILYHNETWGIKITDKDCWGTVCSPPWDEDEDDDDFFPMRTPPEVFKIIGSNYFMTDRHLICRDRVRDLRRFQITLNFKAVEGDAYLMSVANAAWCVNQARKSVREVCNALSTLPCIKYLHLRFVMPFPQQSDRPNYPVRRTLAHPEGEIDELMERRTVGKQLTDIVLTYFGGLVRRVKEVEIKIQPEPNMVEEEDICLAAEFVESLQKKMTSTAPVDPLIERYEALERFVKGAVHCKSSMESVQEALEMGLPADEFERRRAATTQTYWRKFVMLSRWEHTAMIWEQRLLQ